MAFAHPEYLVETDWLAAHLNNPSLRVLDCTIVVHDNQGQGQGYRVESGDSVWQKGHIPGIRAKFAAVKATNQQKVITYCAVGFTACSDAFVLSLLGVENLAMYDGSLTEWTADPAMPMVTG